MAEISKGQVLALGLGIGAIGGLLTASAVNDRTISDYVDKNSKISYLKSELTVDKFEQLEKSINSNNPGGYSVLRPLEWQKAFEILKNKKPEEATQILFDRMLGAIRKVK